jgi:CHAT domain-containing protein
MTYQKLHLSILLSSLLVVLPGNAIQPPDPVPNSSISPVANNPLLNYAQTLNQQGTDYLAAGKADLALKSWREAHKIYTQIRDEQGIVGTEINQAQALRSLGFYRQSLVTLQSVNTRLQKQSNSALKVRGLFSLGNALQSLGVLDKKASNARDLDLGAMQVLDRALKIANDIDDPHLAAQIKLSLGNTLQTIGGEQLVPAIATYQELTSSAYPLVKVQAKLNLYRLANDKVSIARAKYQKIKLDDNRPEAKLDAERNLSSLSQFERSLPQPKQFLADIRTEIENIPPTTDTIYIHINLAEAIIARLKNERKPQQSIFAVGVASALENRDLLIQVSKLLTTAIGQARSIKDARGEAQALGSLGHLYELTSQYSEAQQLTERALIIVENLPAPDIAYELNWQLGRVLAVSKPENTSSAIAAYSQAVSHLKSLRNDLNTTDKDLQFTFRDRVEPVYREYVNLLLRDGKPSDKNLETARDSIESLQVAELEDFLRQGCLDKYTVRLDKIDRSAVVIYPIVLPDRIAVIASIPNQKPIYYSQKISAEKVRLEVADLQNKIALSETAFGIKTKPAFEQQSKKVYDLLLAPLAKDLQQTSTKTLVFVLDDVFRNLPMSVLYDGNKYTIEKYNIALTPGLQLVPPQSEKNRGKRQALLGGVSEQQGTFSALPQVEPELEAIGRLLPSEKLINSQFNNQRISNNLTTGNSQIVHFATHGEFSSKPEDTFLLTWNDRLDLNRLSSLLRNRGMRSGREIDLLVLTACYSAQGDNRATLGLAGVAIQSRAKSTIASLWRSDDVATPILITDFYQNLITKKLGKAESLRKAQLSLLNHPNAKYHAPYYWGSFVLVGNWE